MLASARATRHHRFIFMVETFLRAVCNWATEEREILAAGVVGSHASGTARADSDVDLILVVCDPARFFADPEWTHRFGEVHDFREEDWGRCRSMRVYYLNGLEVEFGFVVADWASADPVDPGTKDVLSGGIRLLYDPDTLLQRLAGSVRSA